MKYKSSNKFSGCFRAKDISSLYAYVLLLFLLLASCGETVEVVQPELPVGTPVSVTADLQISVLPFTSLTEDGVTRADVAMSTAEKEIKSAYVVQFDGTAATSTAVWVSPDVSAQLNSGSAVNCNFTLSKGAKSRVYVVANPKSIPVVDMTLQAFETVAYTVSASLPATGLPMVASQDVTSDDAFGTFALKSALSKLTFKTNTGTLALKGIPSAYSLYAPTPGDDAVRPSGVTYTNTIALTSGTAYYIPANLSGRVSLSDEILRCATFAPAGAMHVVVTAKGTTYNYYLGDGSVSDFNVVAGCAYTLNTTLTGTGSSFDMRIGTPPSITALDGSGTANCYIATSPNAWYSFSGTVMGNGKTTPAHTAGIVPGDINSPAIIPSPLSPASTKVLWETWNTTTTPIKGSVVRGVYLANGRVIFRSGTSEGNAVVAVYKSSETDPCWSWHIWRVNTDPRTSTFTFPAYTSTEGTFDDTGTTSHPGLTMMAYNLGALNNSTNDNLSIGLHYQWGRKDPFPGSADLSAAKTTMATTLAVSNTNGSYSPTGSDGSIVNSVAYPTKYYTSSSSPYNWCSVRNDNLWGTPLTKTVSVNSKAHNSNLGSKSIYDPCPVGWRVPPGYVYTDFENSSWSTSGRLYNSVWFPASGKRDAYNGSLGNIGSHGIYWVSASSAGSPTYGGILVFDSGSVRPADPGYRANGYSCRCVKE